MFFSPGECSNAVDTSRRSSSRFPFYYWIKIAIVLWIASPSGSTFLYKRFIQPLLREREQDIDQLIEHTRQKGYSAILDLTNKGIRYASNMVLNSAVLVG